MHDVYERLTTAEEQSAKVDLARDLQVIYLATGAAFADANGAEGKGHEAVQEALQSLGLPGEDDDYLFDKDAQPDAEMLRRAAGGLGMAYTAERADARGDGADAGHDGG